MSEKPKRIWIKDSTGLQCEPPKFHLGIAFSATQYVEASAYEAGQIELGKQDAEIKTLKEIFALKDAEIARLEAQEKHYRKEASEQALRGDRLLEKVQTLEAERDRQIGITGQFISANAALLQERDSLKAELEQAKGRIELLSKGWPVADILRLQKELERYRLEADMRYCDVSDEKEELRAHADKLAAALDKIRYSTANNVSMDIAFIANEALAEHERFKNGV